MINSKTRVIEREQKTKLIFDSVLASQLVEGIAVMMNGSKGITVRQLWDYFPELFSAEKEQFDKAKIKEELNSFKETRNEFARRHNSKIRGEG